MFKRSRVPTLKLAQYEYELLKREEMRKKRKENEGLVVKDKGYTVQLLDFRVPIENISIDIRNCARMHFDLKVPVVRTAKIEDEQVGVFGNDNDDRSISDSQRRAKNRDSEILNNTVSAPIQKDIQKPKRGRPPGSKNKKRRKIGEDEDYIGPLQMVKYDEDADDENDERGRKDRSEDVLRGKRMGRPPGKKDSKPRKIRKDFIERIRARHEDISDAVQNRCLRKVKIKEDEFPDDDANSAGYLSENNDDESEIQSELRASAFKSELFSHILKEINRRILAQSFQTALPSLSCS